VLFSVWENGIARAAVSLDEAEASRLAGFLEETAGSDAALRAESDPCDTAQTL
jgi:hypothetical protein